MTHATQQIIVTAAAVLALAWLVLNRLRRRGAKDKCANCALADAARQSPPPRR